MEGLEISVVRLSQLNEEVRIDAEYFSKENLEFNKKILSYNHKRIIDFSEVTDGEHGSPDLDDNSGILYLSGHNVKNNILDLTDIRYCSEKLYKKNIRSALKENSVLISIVGTVGNATVVYKKLKANTDRNVATIKNIMSEVNPYYLSTFLNSKFGKYQTSTFATGNVQPLLNLTQVKSIIVCLPSHSFQSQIESIVKSAHAKLEESKSLYSQAEDLLLGELGLKDWQPKNTLHTTKKFSDFAQSGRLDAEYYQPKYDEIEKELARFEQIKIKDFINYPVSSGSTPKAGDSQYYADCNDGIPFLRAVDIVESRIDTSDLIYIKKDVHNGLLKRTQLKKGDVLFSIAGTVGRCGIFDYDFEANINQAIAILRFEETKLKHLYVVQFFNSKIGQLIIQKYARQGLQTNLNLDELSNLSIPILPEAIQTKIASLIQQSFECKAQSKQLLEDAKRMVEAEIEKN